MQTKNCEIVVIEFPSLAAHSWWSRARFALGILRLPVRVGLLGLGLILIFRGVPALMSEGMQGLMYGDAVFKFAFFLGLLVCFVRAQVAWAFEPFPVEYRVAFKSLEQKDPVVRSALKMFKDQQKSPCRCDLQLLLKVHERRRNRAQGTA